MPLSPLENVTDLLIGWSNGDQTAYERLVPLVYAELHRLAHHYMSQVYASLHDKEQAIAWLERGVNTGAIGAFYRDEPVWDSVREDSRFSMLLQRMGVPQ